MSKNTKHSDPLREGLMERRSVVLSGEITDESIAEVGRGLLQLQMLSTAPINLIIGSGGGAVYPALTLCDLITNVMTAPVRGIAFGQCGSSATFIMLHCAERLSTPHSQFLIHSGSRNQISVPINKTTSESLEQLLQETKDIEAMVLKLYMSRLTPAAWSAETTEEEKRQYVLKLIDRGDQSFNELMHAEEAVKVGLIERIIEDKLDIFSD